METYTIILTIRPTHQSRAIPCHILDIISRPINDLKQLFRICYDFPNTKIGRHIRNYLNGFPHLQTYYQTDIAKLQFYQNRWRFTLVIVINYRQNDGTGIGTFFFIFRLADIISLKPLHSKYYIGRVNFLLTFLRNIEVSTISGERSFSTQPNSSGLLFKQSKIHEKQPKQRLLFTINC